MHYKRIVLGGTFDHFHKGHKTLLDVAITTADTLSLGITLPVLYHHKPFASSIESYEVREQTVREYFRQKHALKRVTIVPIEDVFGTTLTDPALDAILATPATEANVTKVNKERMRNGMTPLPLVIVPLLRGDDGKSISSERIRRGDIDRNGMSYRRYFLSKKDYVLPTRLRRSLQAPFGDVITDIYDLSALLKPDISLFSVGDVVSLSLRKAGYAPLLSIIDGKTQREKIDSMLISRYFPTPKQMLSNPPGTITKRIVEEYDSAMTQHSQTKDMQLILVDGEEDLLALPIMLFAPLQSVVIYGLQDQGMVVVTVTEALKSRLRGLLEQF